ncbi:UNVERIFIED_CONTAM: hypothetical protein Sradi_0728300 [Sesamum radiatum]|uniref:Uncharacterized protein n=1 Tax=Sesamum radiatum TaxID=300843 RepID=A0AAW2VNZ7_SESRA
MTSRTDWKELEPDTSKISLDLREIQKTVQDYGHRLIHIPMKIEVLSQKMDEILKILPDLQKGLTDMKTEVADLKKNQRDSPETSKSRQERIRDALGTVPLLHQKGKAMEIPKPLEQYLSFIATCQKIMTSRTDWKELEPDTSKISLDLREIQKTVQDYGHRLIHIPMKIEVLSQKMDEILKILPDLQKGLTDMKTEVADLKKNQRDSPETSKSRQERIRDALGTVPLLHQKGRRWRFQSQKLGTNGSEKLSTP